MRSVLIAGSTGEAATLEPGERIALVEGVRKAVGGAVPVLAGTGAPWARQAAGLTADAADAGADAALVLSPPGAADLAGYYGHVVDANPAVPVMAYHFTNMSAPGIDVDELPALAALRGHRSEGLLGRHGPAAADARRVCPGTLYVGSPWVLVDGGAIRATGALLAVANVEPELSGIALPATSTPSTRSRRSSSPRRGHRGARLAGQTGQLVTPNPCLTDPPGRSGRHRNHGSSWSPTSPSMADPFDPDIVAAPWARWSMNPAPG